MNLVELLPKKLKYYIKKKFRIPTNTYQNVHTTVRVNHYHSGEFNKFHNKFCQNDFQLKNNDITRFKNYMNYRFADYAIRNNKNGNFLSVGVSYGTVAKTITHLLDSKVKDIKYFLIDNYKDIGNKNYNLDINNVKKDLNDIKNFNFFFIEELLSQKSLNKVEKDLIFTHLATGNLQAEFELLPEIISKTKINGVIVMESYGSNEQLIDDFVSENKNLFKIVLPSRQCVIINFSS